MPPRQIRKYPPNRRCKKGKEERKERKEGKRKKKEGKRKKKEGKRGKKKKKRRRKLLKTPNVIYFSEFFLFLLCEI